MGWLVDSLRNLITGMGGASDKSSGAEFVTRLISDVELESMFRDDWIAKKIVKIPAYDMVRNWRQWNCEDADVTTLEAEESRLQIAAKLLKGLIWSRLYGGAALILDDGGNPQGELKADKFGQGRLKQVHVVSRRRLTIPEAFETDIRSPFFGQPKMFGVAYAGSQQVTVHPSRVIPIFGELAPDTDDQADFWGDSILRSVYDAVQHAAKSAHGFAQLVDEAKVDLVSVKNLKTQLSEQQSSQTVIARWSLFGLNKSMNGVGLLDADEEEHSQKQISFDGHDRILMAFLVIVSGAADIPATRMLGQSPNGLNATGESDLTNYYNAIEGRQKTDLSSVMDRLDAFLIPHALGTRPKEIWFDWRPLWTPTPVQKSQLVKTYSEAAKIMADGALVNPVALQKGFESLLIETGVFPGFELALQEAEEAAPEENEILPGEGDEDEEEDESDERDEDKSAGEETERE